MTTSEIGRELKANELHSKTIVILVAEHHPNTLLTMWVDIIGQDFVSFYAGIIRSSFIAMIREDGSLADDRGRVIRVYEYLGQP
jgi:membrane protein YqaA with SNARE-associated domain